MALYQFNIVFGILIAYVSNYSLQSFGNEPWRWMVGIESIPALIYLLGIMNIPYSPRWLLMSNKNPSLANEIFKELNGRKLNDSELNNIISSVNNIIYNLFSVIFAFLIAFFNQLSGINAFLYYAPRIFEAAGLEET